MMEVVENCLLKKLIKLNLSVGKIHKIRICLLCIIVYIYINILY